MKLNRDCLTLLLFALLMLIMGIHAEDTNAAERPYDGAEQTIDLFYCMVRSEQILLPNSDSMWRKMARGCNIAVGLKRVEWHTVWIESMRRAGIAVATAGLDNGED